MMTNNALNFMQSKRALSVSCLLAAMVVGGPNVVAADAQGVDNKSADMTKPVKVFILMGQSNAVGMGKVASLDAAIKEKKKYLYLVDEAGGWSERKDVRNVFIMSGKIQVNDWLSVKNRRTLGVEYALGHCLGSVIDEPVMILKSCIGNRSLGWDLLPPGSKGYEFTEKNKKTGQEVVYTYAGYKESPMRWEKGTEPQKIGWYAGKQYDDDTANAKTVLAELDTYYPGAKGYEIVGFFFWQGDKDRYDAGLASRYEQNLVQLIKQLRSDFSVPNAKFVLATLGQTKKGEATGNDRIIFDAQMAVDGQSGKYPEFKGNVTSVYSNPFCHGGASNGHYDGNAETYMDIGEAMGKAMVDLLKK